MQTHVNYVQAVQAVHDFLDELHSKYIFLPHTDFIEEAAVVALRCAMLNEPIEARANKFKSKIINLYDLDNDFCEDVIKRYTRALRTINNAPPSTHSEVNVNVSANNDEHNDIGYEDYPPVGTALSVKELNQNKLIVTQEEAQCVICVENIEINTIQRILKCKHTFHYECIDRWFEKGYSCPVCRRNLKGQ